MKCLMFLLVLALFVTPVRGQAILARETLSEKPAQRGNFLFRPFRDKPVAVLSAIQAGAVTWDNVTTRISEDHGNFETNPIMRPFAHNSASLAAEGVGTVWLSAFVADHMKHSRSIVLRKVWWMPQVFNISLAFVGGVHNTSVLKR